MKRFLLVFCLTSLVLEAARAENNSGATIELARKSGFEAIDARNPFWPIGWKKPGPKSPTTETGPGLSPDVFALSSVTMGDGPHFAILNGKIIQEGQQFGLQFGSQIYQVTLRTIEDGRVTLAYQDSEIVVPLRRK